MADSESDVSKALAAFGAPPLKYHSFSPAAIQPPPAEAPEPAAPAAPVQQTPPPPPPVLRPAPLGAASPLPVPPPISPPLSPPMMVTDQGFGTTDRPASVESGGSVLPSPDYRPVPELPAAVAPQPGDVALSDMFRFLASQTLSLSVSGQGGLRDVFRRS